MAVHGLLLAAGAGRRAGGPKALVRGGDGVPWLRRGADVLREGGCARVTVVLGAAADEAAALVPEEHVVVASGWSEGMGASLRAGLAAVAAEDPAADAALVLLVDLPDVGAAVIERVLAAAGDRDVLARAAYHGEPGHPVLLGRDHWAEVAEGARGDRGAREVLARHAERVQLVECGDLATGADVDAPGR